MDGFDNLKFLKRIGSKGAAILLSTIGNVQDFRSAKQLAAYIGIMREIRRRTRGAAVFRAATRH